MKRRKVLRLAAVSSAALFVLRGRLARAEVSASTAKALAEAKLIYVATRRKDGGRSEAAPIWFSYDQGDVFFTTSPESWKARRIAAGSPVYIWVGSEEGPFLMGQAERIDDPKVVEQMGKLYEDKYWIAWMGLFRPRSDRVTAGKTIAYRVKVTEGTPPPPSAKS
jgi:PPOX class probable F420-dependent enzyme